MKDPALLFHDLQISASDRQRLSKAVGRIVIERISVMLIGGDVHFLERCGEALCQMLRRDGGLEIAVLNEEDDQFFLERFNSLLGNLSVEQARAAPAAASKGHVWLMSVQSESRLVSARNLARMVHDFPGGNLSLILLIDPELAQVMAKTRPGRAMMRCTLKPAALTGGAGDSVHTGAGPVAEAKPSALPVLPRSGAALEEGRPFLTSAIQSPPTKRRGLNVRVLWLTLVMLAASAVLVGVAFYAPQNAQPLLSATGTVPPAALALPDPDSPRLPSLAAPPAEVAVSAPLPAMSQAREAQSAEPANTDLAGKPLTLALRLEETQSWLASAPAATHTIQLTGSNDERQLEAYLQRLSQLVDPATIRVFRTKAGGRDSLTVVWGSFADAREASLARDKLPAELRSAKPIIRTVQGINAELKR